MRLYPNTVWVPIKVKGLFLLLCIVLLSACQSTGVKPEKTSEAIAQQEKRADTYTRLGIGYMEQGKYEVALAKFDKAIEADSNYSPAYGYKAVLNERLKQLEEADQNYQTAIRLNPKDDNIGNFYGSFLCKNERFDEAEAVFLQVIQNPFNLRQENAMINAGRCARLEPDLEKAEQYFRQASERNKQFALPLLELAKLSYSRNKLSTARAYMQRYFGLARKSPKTLWLALRIERGIGDETEIARYTYLLKSKFPDSLETKALVEAAH